MLTTEEKLICNACKITSPDYFIGCPLSALVDWGAEQLEKMEKDGWKFKELRIYPWPEERLKDAYKIDLVVKK